MLAVSNISNIGLRNIWTFWHKIYISSIYTGVSFAFVYFTRRIFNEIIWIPFRMPWNQQTKLGYFAEMCHSIVVTIYYFLFNGVFLLTFIGLCLHHQAFYQMFQHRLRTHDDPDQNNAEILRHLVCFHISVKEWVIKFQSHLVN